jgi:chromosomal replication initiator protein
LFIYGGVGLGKTHLIQAIGNELLLNNPSYKIRYVPAERYMTEIVEALRNQGMNRLKEKYREVDLLILDDIQFIARTEKMQEEFFHTFNALYEKNKQIIISSDRPPNAIATLEDRLRSRFEGGMIADVGLPDIETRLLILKTKADTKQITISEDVLLFIADKIKNNIRELEGALNRIIISSKLSNSPITVEIAKRSIMSHASSPKKFISAKKIIKAVVDFYDIEERDLLHRSRKKDVVRPRQIAMYLMLEELKSSYPIIGERLGGRDHTTAIHSCEKIGQELLTNSELEEELQAIKNIIFTN